MVNRSDQIVDLTVNIFNSNSNLVIFMIENIDFSLHQVFRFRVVIFDGFQFFFALFKLFNKTNMIFYVNTFLFCLGYQFFHLIVDIRNFCIQFLMVVIKFGDFLVPAFLIFFCLNQNCLYMMDILSISRMLLLNR